MRRERLWLTGILAAFSVSVLFAIAQGAPFEVDESVYATQARAWAAGGPTTGILPHRAPLMPAIGTLIYKAGARSEWPFRVTGLFFGLAAVVFVWALGRLIAGPRAGLLAAAVFAAAPTIELRSSQFMTDVPATAFLLAATLILLLNRERVTRTLLLFAPAAAGAIYARYASVLPVALLVVAFVIWCRAALTARWQLASATLALTALLLVPHVVHAINVTGKPWGLVTFTAGYAGRRYIGQGLRDYVYWFPVALAGPLAGVAMIAGLIGSILTRSVTAAFFVSVAVVDIVVIGLVDHGEARFIFFPIALLCIAGAVWIARMEPSWLAVAACAAALAASGVYVAHRTDRARTLRAPPALAGRTIASLAQHHPCVVLSVDVGPTTWYSGCSTYYFNDPAYRRADFMLIYRQGGVLLRAQPSQLPLLHGPPIAVTDAHGREAATVFVVARPVE
jgi:hypothetical protein